MFSHYDVPKIPKIPKYFVSQYNYYNKASNRIVQNIIILLTSNRSDLYSSPSHLFMGNWINIPSGEETYAEAIGIECF